MTVKSFIVQAPGVKNEIKWDDGKWVLNGTAEKILQSLNSMNPGPGANPTNYSMCVT
jgi:hypothetical protein